MKKVFLLTGWFILILGFVSCQPQEFADNPYEREIEGEKVTFDMSFTLPETALATKALGPGPVSELRNIYVAVFGSGHYLNEFVKAIPYQTDGSGNKTVSIDNEGNLKYVADGSGHYNVRVTLTASTSRRYVHILANVDDSEGHFPDFNEYENSVMLNRIVAADGDGYWQHLVFPDGIDSSQEAAFQNVSLIRNFAQVDVALGTVPFNEGWSLSAFKVYNTPTRGLFPVISGSSIENGTKFYIYDVNYASKSFSAAVAQAKRLEYEDGDYCNLILSSFDGEAVPGSALPSGTDASPKFVFENPLSDEYDTAFVIVQLTNPSSETKFFRLDFRGPDETLIPLLRNFTYSLTIGAIANDGYATPAEAALHPSTRDVFVDVDITEVTKLDNGISSLQVKFVEKVFTATHSNEPFEYLYLEGISNTGTAGNVEATLPTGDAIAVASETEWMAGGNPVGSEGWRRMNFNVNAPPANGRKVSTFTVFAEHSVYHTLLQQTITVISMDKINLSSTLVKDNRTGIYSLAFELPADLPKSIFPLSFEFSQADNKISPAGVGSLVNIGSDGVFTFQVDVSYDDYLQNNNVRFDFIAVKAIASGDELVFKDQVSSDHDPYFVEKTVDLNNFSLGYILAQNLTVSPSLLPLGLNQETTVSFDYLAGVDGSITVTLTNLVPKDETVLQPTGNSGVYTFDVTAATDHYSFVVKSSTRFTEGFVELSMSDYLPVSSGEISRPKSFTVPSGTLRAANGPVSDLTWVYAYTSRALNTYIDADRYRTRFTVNNDYSSRQDLTVDLTRYGDDKESGSVYFYYSTTSLFIFVNQYYANVSLADLFDNISTGVDVTFSTTAP